MFYENIFIEGLYREVAPTGIAPGIGEHWVNNDEKVRREEKKRKIGKTLTEDADFMEKVTVTGDAWFSNDVSLKGKTWIEKFMEEITEEQRKAYNDLLYLTYYPSTPENERECLVAAHLENLKKSCRELGEDKPRIINDFIHEDFHKRRQATHKQVSHWGQY